MGSVRKTPLESRPLTPEERRIMAKDGVPLIKKFVSTRFPNEPAAVKEELISEGYLCVCERMNTFDISKSAFSSHVYRILNFDLRNFLTCHKHVKRTELCPSQIGAEPMSQDESMDMAMEMSEKNGMLQKSRENTPRLSPVDLEYMIHHLSDPEKQVLQMFVILEMTIAEIAESMKLEPKAVYYLKNRALEKIREEMPAKMYREIKELGW